MPNNPTPKKRLPDRLKALRATDRGQATHRFKTMRRASIGLTLAILYAVPLFHVARLDLWDGRSRLFGKAVGTVFGFEAIVLCTIAFYGATFLLNAAFGRIFCGWGCPVGEASRLADDADLSNRIGEKRLLGNLRSIGFSILMGAAVALWFLDPRVFVEGTPKAISLSLLSISAVSGLFYLQARHLRWRFCRSFCPIGIYYSAVQTAHKFGVHFFPELCKGCDACTQICPVQLHPRELARVREEQGGLSLGGFPEQNHCLTCGDCVRACENASRKEKTPLVALRLTRKVPIEQGRDARKA